MLAGGGDGREDSVLTCRLGGRGPRLPDGYISKALRSLRRTLLSCRRYNTSQGEGERIHDCSVLFSKCSKKGSLGLSSGVG